MKPAWDKLMAEYKDSKDVLIGDADCTADAKSLCEEIGVQGYPTYVRVPIFAKHFALPLHSALFGTFHSFHWVCARSCLTLAHTRYPVSSSVIPPPSRITREVATLTGASNCSR